MLRYIPLHPANSLLEEMQGHEELGMHDEALAMARKILAMDGLRPGYLEDALQLLLRLSPLPPEDVALAERAHQSLPESYRHHLRPCMLGIYYSLGDSTKAMTCITQNPKDGSDFMMSLNVLNEMEKHEEAEILASKGLRLAEQFKNPWEKSCIYSALADHLARQRRWDEALILWERVPDRNGLSLDKLVEIANIRIAQAIQSVRTGYESLQALAKAGDPDLALSQPGLDDELIKEIRGRLAKMLEGLELAMPEKVRKRFGL